jgi:hypothetical protein
MMTRNRRLPLRPNTALQPTAEDLLVSLASSVPSLRAAAAERER